MILVSYDISNTKLRTHFSKDLSKFGFRLQYSLFELANSEHVLDNVISIIDGKYSKQFTENDSVMIIKLNPRCDIIKYGYARNEDADMFIIE